MEKGVLYIVGTPIGNYADLTFRALRILKEADFIICEEYKEAVRLLKFFNIKKDLKQINEHNEKDNIEELINELLSGKNAALISDGGMPVFADPGNMLISECIKFGIKADVIPGANSVLAALVSCGFDISRFCFFGFLSPKTDIRQNELNKISTYKKVIVLMDAPYRLTTLLSDTAKIFPDKNCYIGIDLTTENELHLRDTVSGLLSRLSENKLKAEFILILDNTK